MRLLLDSQALVLITKNSDALPARAKSAIKDGNNEVFLSIVSPLELQIKVNTGKLQLGSTIRQIIDREVETGTVTLLPITLDHIDKLATLPAHHRDPFDRLLIAQAICENLTIVTSDQAIARYPVPVLWE